MSYLNLAFGAQGILQSVQMEGVNTVSLLVLCLFPKDLDLTKTFPYLQGRDAALTLMSVPPIPVARVRRASMM